MMHENFFNGNGLSSFWYGFHGLVCLTFLVGLTLVIIWAIRNLKKNQLLHWGIGLLMTAALLWLIGMSSGGFSFHNHMLGSGYWPTSEGMWKCVQDEVCHEEMEDWMEERMGIR